MLTLRTSHVCNLNKLLYLKVLTNVHRKPNFNAILTFYSNEIHSCWFRFFYGLFSFVKQKQIGIEKFSTNI